MTEEFSKLIIRQGASLREAMKQLDQNAEKILFVVSDSSELIGSLSDGDIRRWILKEGLLTASVQDVCHRATYYVRDDYQLESVKIEMMNRKIMFVPVVDDQNNISQFLSWDNLFGERVIRKDLEKLDNPVIIMAGGKGTRLDPFTKILPKPLIPIGDKTILELIIDKFLNYNIGHFYVSVNHKAKIIKSYFEELQPDYKISYLYEDKPLGTVGAIRQLAGKISGNLILTNCDIIIEANYADLVRHHIEQQNDLTIVASVKHFNIPYGICEIENGGDLIQMKEKPEFSFLVNTGMYVIKSDLIDFIPENEFYHITHLIDKIKSHKKVGVFPIGEDAWIDTGEWIEYKKALDKLK